MSSAFKIEDSIPVPSAGRHGLAKYPWSTLEVGQSFFVASPPKHFSSQVATASRVYGRKFSYRTVDGGSRVWRIA